MNTFHEVSTRDLKANTFHAMDKEWMLITAANEEKVNMMTASWGGLGVIWGKDVATIYLRPQRFTKTYIDATNEFSICFFDESYRSMLAYCGKASGRNEDKVAHTNLTTVYEDHVPYFAEASTVLICKTLYKQPMEKSDFIQPETYEKWYPSNDLHTMYIGEIVKVLQK